MASTKKLLNNTTLTSSSRKKRPGIHAKTKRSFSKKSKNWAKQYRGQGK